MCVQHKDQKNAMFNNRTEQSAGNSLMGKIKDIWSLLYTKNNNNNGKNNKDANHKNRFVWSIHFDAIESQVLRVCFSNDLSHILHLFSLFFFEKYFITLLMETLFFFHSVLPNETIHLQTLFIFFFLLFVQCYKAAQMFELQSHIAFSANVIRESASYDP